MPLTFDLPLEQLEQYQGCNPRPKDFDKYWDESLEEIKSIDPQIEILPSEFKTDFAQCSHLYFTGIGGARVHAKLIQPKNSEKPNPAVLMFHGYYGHSGDWSGKLNYAANGYTVAALDCRGQGGLSSDTGNVPGWTLSGHIIRGLDGSAKDLLYRSVFLDTVQLAQIVMDLPQVDENRIGVTGGSQGGALTLACAALEPRIKLAAPVFPFLCDYKRVWDIDLAENAYQELKEYFRKFDPQHKREMEIFERLGYIDVQYLCPRIRAEVFMGVGFMDKICPPSTQFAAYNKIKSPKSMAIFPDYGHEPLPGIDDEIYQFLSRL